MGELLAPPGWGHVPGMPLGDITADTLPDLPMLRFLNGRRRAQAIVEALRDLPYVRRVDPQMVMARYGVACGTAYNIVLLAQTGKSRYEHCRERLEAAA